MTALPQWLGLPPGAPCDVLHCKSGVDSVYIGRGATYGNPFPMRGEHERQGIIDSFRGWLAGQPELLRYVRQTLPGKRIGCYCSPKPCHGDVLSEVAAGRWDHLIPEEPLLVFGSNLAGRHGKGAAKSAKLEYGAVPGVGVGITGHAYALPTKDHVLKPLPVTEVLRHITTFFEVGAALPHLEFRMTRVGCGLSGLPETVIRDHVLANAPCNVQLPGAWLHHFDPSISRVVVAVSRGVKNYTKVERKLDALLSRLGNIEIVSPGAGASDSLGERYAVERGLKLRRMPAFWHAFPRQAGHIRNRRMSWYGTHLVAFWDGHDRGTRGMIDLANEDGLSLRVISP